MHTILVRVAKEEVKQYVHAVAHATCSWLVATYNTFHSC